MIRWQYIGLRHLEGNVSDLLVGQMRQRLAIYILDNVSFRIDI